jgi:hypothetical protein
MIHLVFQWNTRCIIPYSGQKGGIIPHSTTRSANGNSVRTRRATGFTDLINDLTPDVGTNSRVADLVPSEPTLNTSQGTSQVPFFHNSSLRIFSRILRKKSMALGENV